MNKRTIITIVIAVSITVFLWWTSHTVPIVLVFIPVLLISLFLYFKKWYKSPPNPKRILPLYLAALAIQMLHFTEEYITNFPIVIPKLFGQNAYPINNWVIFNMVAYSLFILGGIALYKERNEYLIIPLFFIMAGVFFNAFAHVLTSLYVGQYFSGLYTALLYIFIIPMFINIVFEKK